MDDGSHSLIETGHAAGGGASSSSAAGVEGEMGERETRLSGRAEEGDDMPIVGVDVGVRSRSCSEA